MNECWIAAVNLTSMLQDSASGPVGVATSFARKGSRLYTHQLGGHRLIPFATMSAIAPFFIALHQALLNIYWSASSFLWAVMSDARLLALALFSVC